MRDDKPTADRKLVLNFIINYHTQSDKINHFTNSLEKSIANIGFIYVVCNKKILTEIE